MVVNTPPHPQWSAIQPTPVPEMAEPNTWTLAVEPVDHDGGQRQRHEQHGRRRTLAPEPFVRDPAAGDGSRNGRPLVQRPADARLLEREALGGLEVGRNPVLHAVAHEVAERVGHRDRPQVAVAQHAAEQDLAKAERALVRFAVAGRVVVAVLLHRRQAARLRRVLQQEVHAQRHRRGDECIEVELGAPVVEQQHAHERQTRHQRSADVVRGIPYRHREPALAGAEPVHHGLAARRPAHALYPAVQHLDGGDGQQRAVQRRDEAERGHDRARQQQAERHEVARVAAVGDRPHQELRQTIGDGQSGEGTAERRLVVLRVLAQDVGNGEGEVVADQVIARVADEDAGEHPPAQPPIGRVNLRDRQGRGNRRRLQPADHRWALCQRAAV